MNRVIVITGASSGIGLALKGMFEKEGDIVIGISRTVILEDNYYACDIKDSSKLKSVFEDIESKYKTIDILINCAGFGLSGATELIPETAIRDIFDVNFFAALNCIKFALPMMKNTSRIINIGSVLALFPVPYRTLYCSSKAAFSMLSDCIGMELSRCGIKTTSIHPGEIKTNFTKNRVKNYQTNERYGNSVELSAKYIDEKEQKRMTVEHAAEKIYRIIDRPKLKPMYIVSRKYRFLYFIERFFPKKLKYKVINKLFNKK